ncbi:Ccc1p [Ascoidea rubescens DSM 1968]|uniref:DUF125-domain-containing protein n=1 Tax=Ascoidea rubescens DSM 1968 TaxID=1344418 RepID=A0A1D2VM22_9ASCO|nr:DUF125-domain-containing protein [Ascoidea rubescens DSM 1968]ODV62649.1 DUF125-domain-containing protein [Ascoidea rubescens DSM 1968]
MSLVAVKNIISSVISQQKLKSNPDNKSLNYNTYDSSNYGSTSSCEDYNYFDRSQTIADEDNDSNSQSSSTFDPRVMSDIIIGLSDGLTVPFALTAGLSSLGDSKLVITGGFAELVSGAISMGLGGYLAAKSESQYYHNEVSKEKSLFFKNPESIESNVVDILKDIGISNQNIHSLFIHDLEQKPNKMIDFIIRYGKDLEEPAENRQFTSALTIGISYFLGGFIPLIPYFFVSTVNIGLIISCIVMMITLFLFGYVKTWVSLGNDTSLAYKSYEGIQMVLVGGFAAACAWGFVRLLE